MYHEKQLPMFHESHQQFMWGHQGWVYPNAEMHGGIGIHWAGPQQSDEIWISHYSSKQSILTVGDGDFSFTLSLARRFSAAHNIVATSLDSENELIEKYVVGAIYNTWWLRSYGATVCHGVDARYMAAQNANHLLGGRQRFYDRIIYNFPHAGFLGKEDDAHMIKMHKELVRHFFQNAVHMLSTGGEVHVTHKLGGAYDEWRLVEQAQSSGLSLIGRTCFDSSQFPGYCNRRGAGQRAGESFKLYNSATYIFAARTSLPLYHSILPGFHEQHVQTYRTVSIPSTSRIAPREQDKLGKLKLARKDRKVKKSNSSPTFKESPGSPDPKPEKSSLDSPEQDTSCEDLRKLKSREVGSTQRKYCIKEMAIQGIEDEDGGSNALGENSSFAVVSKPERASTEISGIEDILRIFFPSGGEHHEMPGIQEQGGAHDAHEYKGSLEELDTEQCEEVHTIGGAEDEEDCAMSSRSRVPAEAQSGPAAKMNQTCVASVRSSPISGSVHEEGSPQPLGVDSGSAVKEQDVKEGEVVTTCDSLQIAGKNCEPVTTLSMANSTSQPFIQHRKSSASLLNEEPTCVSEREDAKKCKALTETDRNSDPCAQRDVEEKKWDEKSISSATESAMLPGTQHEAAGLDLLQVDPSPLQDASEGQTTLDSAGGASKDFGTNSTTNTSKSSDEVASTAKLTKSQRKALRKKQEKKDCASKGTSLPPNIEDEEGGLGPHEGDVSCALERQGARTGESTIGFPKSGMEGEPSLSTLGLSGCGNKCKNILTPANPVLASNETPIPMPKVEAREVTPNHKAGGQQLEGKKEEKQVEKVKFTVKEMELASKETCSLHQIKHEEISCDALADSLEENLMLKGLGKQEKDGGEEERNQENTSSFTETPLQLDGGPIRSVHLLAKGPGVLKGTEQERNWLKTRKLVAERLPSVKDSRVKDDKAEVVSPGKDPSGKELSKRVDEQCGKEKPDPCATNAGCGQKLSKKKLKAFEKQKPAQKNLAQECKQQTNHIDQVEENLCRAKAGNGKSDVLDMGSAASSEGGKRSCSSSIDCVRDSERRPTSSTDVPSKKTPRPPANTHKTTEDQRVNRPSILHEGAHNFIAKSRIIKPQAAKKLPVTNRPCIPSSPIRSLNNKSLLKHQQGNWYRNPLGVRYDFTHPQCSGLRASKDFGTNSTTNTSKSSDQMAPTAKLTKSQRKKQEKKDCASKGTPLPPNEEGGLDPHEGGVSCALEGQGARTGESTIGFLKSGMEGEPCLSTLGFSGSGNKCKNILTPANPVFVKMKWVQKGLTSEETPMPMPKVEAAEVTLNHKAGGQQQEGKKEEKQVEKVKFTVKEMELASKETCSLRQIKHAEMSRDALADSLEENLMLKGLGKQKKDEGEEERNQENTSSFTETTLLQLDGGSIRSVHLLAKGPRVKDDKADGRSFEEDAAASSQHTQNNGGSEGESSEYSA